MRFEPSVTRKALLTAVLAGTFSTVSPTASAAMQTLTPMPAPQCNPTLTGNDCLNFGDFNVFSLPLLNFGATGSDSAPKPGDPYYVKSTPGQLANPGYIVFGTGSGNQKEIENGNTGLIDNAYATPNSSGGQTSFSSLTASEPLPDGFAGDQVHTWDAQLAALRSQMLATSGSNQFNVYFNLNETGGDNLTGIDLLIFAVFTLDDGNGNTQSFYLGGGPQYLNDPNAYMNHAALESVNLTDLTNAGATPAFDSSSPWTYVHGTICVAMVGGQPTLLGFGPCSTDQKAAGGHDLNQNLGADTAAFAISNQALSNAILDPNSGWEYLHVSWLMSYEDNGYEQAFAALNTTQQQIPEPATLALVGLGSLALGFARRRKH